MNDTTRQPEPAAEAAGPSEQLGSYDIAVEDLDGDAYARQPRPDRTAAADWAASLLQHQGTAPAQPADRVTAVAHLDHIWIGADESSLGHPCHKFDPAIVSVR